MFENFTKKQRKFIYDIIKGNTKRINILEGSVRSGKTYVSLIAWIILLSQLPQDHNYLMVGKTLTSLKRNCLSILEGICPTDSFEYSTIKKEAKIFGRRVFLEGVNDTRAEHKIRGMTLQATYCDEITLFTEDFFSMLLSRLSLQGSLLLGTTNPDAPTHWLMKKFISREGEISLKTWKFLLDDNNTIDKSIRDEMKKEYTGVFYERFILGNWVQAEGIIYDNFANYTSKYLASKIRLNDIDLVNIGVDYGASKSKTAAVACAFTNEFKNLVVLDEVQFDGVNNPEILYFKLGEFYNRVHKRYGIIGGIYADWGGLGQIITKGLKIYLNKNCENAKVFDCKKTRIIDRIQILNRLIGANRFKVFANCINVIEALKTAIWDPKHDDMRLDDGTTNIDILDALEYAYTPQITNLNTRLNETKFENKRLPII